MKKNSDEEDTTTLDYSHHSSVKVFQLAIPDVIRDGIVSGVKDSDCFSLMFDESTDVSVSQNLIVYIRYLRSRVDRVEPTTSFLAIQPDILATHCIAQLLALRSGGAADKIPYLVKFQGLLNDIFKFFRNSGENTASLKAIQSIVDQTSRSKKFKEVFHTRWLSFDGALQALLQNYSSLVSLFLEETSGKALSLHKPITCYKFLYVAHYLADVMDHLSRLSKMNQRSDLDFTDVNPMLEATIETIQELMETKTGATPKKFLASAPATPTVDDDGHTTFQFGFHTVRDGPQQRKEALSACDSFTDY